MYLKKNKLKYKMSEEVVVEVNNEVNDMMSKFNVLETKLNNMIKDLKSIVTEVKNTKKEHGKFTKKMASIQKSKQKRKKNKDPDAPKKQKKLVNISDELRTFLNLDATAQVSRADVFSMVRDYVALHNLKREKNGKFFDLTKEHGDKLATIFGVERNDEEIGYFSMQGKLTKHFSDASPVVEQPVEQPVETPVVETPVEPPVVETPPAAEQQPEGVVKQRRRRQVDEAVKS